MPPPAPFLVTGSRGQLGAAVLARCAALGRPAVGLDREALDVTDAEAVRAAVAHHRPEAVLNAAAYTAVDRAETDRERAFAVNAAAPGHLAAACAEAGIPLLHVSTDYVFDGTADRPYTEDDPVNPLGVYARSKAAGEDAVRDRLAQHLIARTAWVFAPGHANFASLMARLFTEREEIAVVTDQLGHPTPADGLARALLDLLNRARERDAWGTVHLAGAPAVSRFAFAEAILDAVRTEGRARCERLNPVTSDAFPAPAPRPLRAELSMERLRSRYGLEPPAWREALPAVVRALGPAEAPK